MKDVFYHSQIFKYLWFHFHSEMTNSANLSQTCVIQKNTGGTHVSPVHPKI